MSIGIFWVYRDVVLGQAVALTAGGENVPGRIDSPQSHVVYWEEQHRFRGQFAELTTAEYQDIPRGRVLYLTKEQRPLVYLDRVLLTPTHKNRIAAFFGFAPVEALWHTDSHYVTNRQALEELFDDETL